LGKLKYLLYKWSMSTLNYKKQLLLTGCLFTLHNLEEAFGFSRFVYPPALPLDFVPLQSNAMILAIGIITVIAWALILWVNHQQKETNRKNLLIILASIFLVNAFFPHIVGSIILHRYFPGVITSIVLFLPYSGWILPKLYRTYVSPEYFLGIILRGFFLAGSLVIILQLSITILFHFFVN